jgi:crotonobetaine/carnitine-CoA ligase
VTAPSSTLAALREASADRPDAGFFRMDDLEFTLADAYERTLAVASGLRALGIEAGDRVAIMSENRPEAVWIWFGANAIGAIDVPINAAARGRFLAYVAGDAAPRVIAAPLVHLETLVQAGVTPDCAVILDETDARPFGPATRHISFAELVALAPVEEPSAPAPGDVASILYTSGTTGPSKGVMVPQHHWTAHGELISEGLELAPGEVVYCAQPLFHQDGRIAVQAGLAGRAVTAIARRFSASNFWNEIRHHRADVFSCVGTMMWLLYKQPESESDRDHTARMAGSSATPAEIHRAFEERFGVEVHQWYGQTETGCVTWTMGSDRRPGSIGAATRHFEVRVVDDADRDVQPGETGEFCCRPTEPNLVLRGYWQKPEATVTAWRNLWFHTGDLVLQAKDGEYEYVGRKNDAIRRRGENISAWEVEETAMRHAGVLEAAAFGVRSDLGEQDVALLVVPRGEPGVDPTDLHAFMSEGLPSFAVPRFIELVDALPKTPSERIEKAKVRERGLSEAAWDAEAR